MFVIEVDSASAEQRIAGMVENVTTMPDKIADELVAWQREDMNRKYPNIARPDPWSAVTLIWPRSRLSMRRDAQRRRGIRRLLISRRPILRPELIEALHERMRGRLREIVSKKQD
jgi:hypothetical protein